MSALTYLLLDDAGLVINAGIVDDPYPQEYWPGDGRYITCAYGQPDPTPPANLDIRMGDRPFTYLTVRPTSYCWIGDTMDIATGAVTPAPPPASMPDEVTE